MTSAVKQGQGQGQGPGVNRSLRQHIVEEQGGYCLDAARVEEQLRLDVSSPSLLQSVVVLVKLSLLLKFKMLAV